MINELKSDLKKLSDPEKAKLLQRFFKTGKGEYGEGDIFLGITVPKQREVAKEYYHYDLKQVKELMESKIHEYRMIGLFILINKYKTTNHKKIVTHFYLKQAEAGNINNWDLVDLSAIKILGTHLLDKDRAVLYKLSKSKNLWERRISVLSCFAFIAKNDFRDALKIAELLLKDEHDLMHKAVGWMLREIGKKDLKTEEKFLKKHYKIMPRTMLRYAIEKFPENKRLKYLRGEI
jgi:3-methyladenine DNA glycosylase AlkD